MFYIYINACDFIAFVCSQAVRTSIYGRPGATYVDIAGDMVNAKVDRSKVRFAGGEGLAFFCLFVFT